MNPITFWLIYTAFISSIICHLTIHIWEYKKSVLTEAAINYFSTGAPQIQSCSYTKKSMYVIYIYIFIHTWQVWFWDNYAGLQLWLVYMGFRLRINLAKYRSTIPYVYEFTLRLCHREVTATMVMVLTLTVTNGARWRINTSNPGHACESTKCRDVRRRSSRGPQYIGKQQFVSTTSRPQSEWITIFRIKL